MYLRIPRFLRALTPNIVWSGDSPGKIYLTFDDGPTPEITESILETLDKYGAKATFFCIGNNAEKYPYLMEKILEAGHRIGNHTYNHAKGWKMSTRQYVKDVERASKVVKSDLFRPPYGRICRLQLKFLVNKKGYKMIFWDLISQDYSLRISPKRCARKVTRYMKAGSIIVFHDSVKASRNMMYALPIVLEEAKRKGLECVVIGNTD